MQTVLFMSSTSEAFLSEDFCINLLYLGAEDIKSYKFFLTQILWAQVFTCCSRITRNKHIRVFSTQTLQDPNIFVHLHIEEFVAVLDGSQLLTPLDT
jgi:hypothetical protein